jgi:hypothetical protein
MQNEREPVYDSEPVYDGDVTQPTSQEELIDRWAIWIVLLLLCVTLFIAVVWVVKLPSFEKCSALGDVSQRHACYDHLRAELLKPPAK